ncbi:class I SAM-dependent methyltransferase [Saccharothrix violaceirubra]|uniref:SAM-dependent methyltransferase n=1 Tax=Saccharothrix violaceirubra TaxID=413306 RepID=A0A7W7WW63_9PSEU|nr:class I SAM-dependent methyltransferase [Saccharothrix violaceirubra]MBB4965642.1 SAM-dependent methyltransferase [Saccharothrix violaceirubra]
MYDLVTPLLNAVAGGPCAIHHGYWADGGASSWEDAADRLTDLVARRTPLGPGTRLLDIGCGTGQPVLRIARDHDIHVTGITVSRVQVELAVEGAHGLRAEFALADAMSLPYADNAFDAAWAVQSLVEMAEPDRAAREAFRVLEPGGVLVVTDVVTRGATPAPDERWPTGLRKCAAGEVVGWLTGAGFEVSSCEDASAGTRYFLPKFASALAGYRRTIEDLYGPHVAEWAAAVGDHENYADEMGYVVVTARKPVG